MSPYNNFFVGTGVVSKYVRGTTQEGGKACSFTLNLPCRDGSKSWIRCNVYHEDIGIGIDIGGLKEGELVSVQGEIMNRRIPTGITVTEVKCSAVFMNKPQEEEEDLLFRLEPAGSKVKQVFLQWARSHKVPMFIWWDEEEDAWSWGIEFAETHGTHSWETTEGVKAGWEAVAELEKEMKNLGWEVIFDGFTNIALLKSTKQS